MTPILYRSTGSYDADTEVRIEADGTATVEGGGYATRGRRVVRLTPGQRTEIDRLGADVEARDWGVPEAADGFVHHLDVGGREVRWWGPAADVDDRLEALVVALSRL